MVDILKRTVWNFVFHTRNESKVVVCILHKMLHHWLVAFKSLISQRQQSRCKLNTNKCSQFFFLFCCWNAKAREHTFFSSFSCTYRRWGNENKMEWMQGLRAPCPACADESQRPELIHTAGPDTDAGHSCRKVLVHAQSHQKTARVAETMAQQLSSRWMWHQPLFLLLNDAVITWV